LWLLLAAILGAQLASAPASAGQIEVCFSPPLPGGCDPLATVVQAIDEARKTVLVQMYALTSREIVSALGNAKHRGIDVRAIVDRSQLKEDRSDTDAVGRLVSAGVPVLVDTVPGLMHNKITIVDGATVITGSFNYTWSAEHKNAENLLLSMIQRLPLNTCKTGTSMRPGRGLWPLRRKVLPHPRKQLRKQRPGRSLATAVA
jgi:phosphatidylserine/phosphatidylglycerophosphate/cardiolipin synthase-like enzyme